MTEYGRKPEKPLRLISPISRNSRIEALKQYANEFNNATVLLSPRMESVARVGTEAINSFLFMVIKELEYLRQEIAITKSKRGAARL